MAGDLSQERFFAGTDKVQKESKKNMRKFVLGYKLSGVAKTVLRQLGEKNSQLETAENLHFSKTRINYWVRKFVRQGFLRELPTGRPKYYELTAIGTKLLTRSEGELPWPCVMEDYPVKFGLLGDAGRVRWEKLGEPRNWEKLGVHIGEVRVEKTSRSVIVHTGQLSGFDPDELLIQAGQIVALVRAVLFDRGVVVADFGVPCRGKAVFKYYTPEADVTHRVCGSASTENGVLDASPPDKIPHQEHDRRVSRDLLDMPVRVRILGDRQVLLEARLKEMDVKLGLLVESQAKMVSLQERFTLAFEQLTMQIPIDAKPDQRMDTYVS